MPILKKFVLQWQFLCWIEILSYTLGVSLFTYLIIDSWVGVVATLILSTVIFALWLKPWLLTRERAASYLDRQLAEAEYSSGLLLFSSESLSSLAQLQQQKIHRHLAQKSILPPHHTFRGLAIMTIFIIAGWVFNQWSAHMALRDVTLNSSKKTVPIPFYPNDSSANLQNIPVAIKNQQVWIDYPDYTRLKTRVSQEMNITALQGSKITWELKLNGAINQILMVAGDKEYAMLEKDNAYYRSIFITDNEFYHFKFSDTNGHSYVSDIYKIEAIPDAEPEIKVNDQDLYTRFDYSESKVMQISTTITDDFGVSDAYVVATVSKGSGESVKFREEKLLFEEKFNKSEKSLILTRTLDLDAMEMTPGDELYFYVEAIDNKVPRPQVSRSETYFAIIKDTASYEFSLAGSLGVDVMPDYFRSQRQIIIDTKKLLTERNLIDKIQFNTTSNELGFDQKALRLKYGQFMGEESESGLDISSEQEQEALDQEKDEDPLSAYTHDHDGDNEHNLVPLKENEIESQQEHSALEAYTHNHDDPEEATFYTASLKSKLRQAMNEMWDAELHLRLYHPEKSLPYQYRALKLIEEIKNSARIYVHRIGFDPPPIKEDNRLTGDIEGLSSYSKSEDIGKDNLYPNMTAAIALIKAIIADKDNPVVLSNSDKSLFKAAGNELAQLAIRRPGQYLSSLQYLNRLVNNGVRATDMDSVLEFVKREMQHALPAKDPNPHFKPRSFNILDEIVVEHLKTDYND